MCANALIITAKTASSQPGNHTKLPKASAPTVKSIWSNGTQDLPLFILILRLKKLLTEAPSNAPKRASNPPAIGEKENGQYRVEIRMAVVVPMIVPPIKPLQVLFEPRSLSPFNDKPKSSGTVHGSFLNSTGAIFATYAGISA